MDTYWETCGRQSRDHPVSTAGQNEKQADARLSPKPSLAAQPVVWLIVSLLLWCLIWLSLVQVIKIYTA